MGEKKKKGYRHIATGLGSSKGRHWEQRELPWPAGTTGVLNFNLKINLARAAAQHHSNVPTDTRPCGFPVSPPGPGERQGHQRLWVNNVLLLGPRGPAAAGAFSALIRRGQSVYKAF